MLPVPMHTEFTVATVRSHRDQLIEINVEYVSWGFLEIDSFLGVGDWNERYDLDAASSDEIAGATLSRRSIAATRLLAPDPQREMTLSASVNGTSTAWTRCRARMYTAPANGVGIEGMNTV